MQKITIRDIQKFKDQRIPFATVTAYDYVSAHIADAVEIPLLLVGDSAAMVVYGMDTTIPISMEEMIFQFGQCAGGQTNPWLWPICLSCHTKHL